MPWEQRAAQVSDEQPLGCRPSRHSKRSPLRHGFGWTSGALLALALGLAERTVAHQLLLVLAAFIAIGLGLAVAFLVRRGLCQGVAVAVITMLALAAVAGFVAARSAALAQQAAELVSQAPKYLQQLNDTAPYWAGSTTSPTWWTSSTPKPLAVPR